MNNQDPEFEFTRIDYAKSNKSSAVDLKYLMKSSKDLNKIDNVSGDFGRVKL